MRKTRVGVLTFSDGRKYIHEDLLETNWKYQKLLVAALEESDVEVVPGEAIVLYFDLVADQLLIGTAEGELRTVDLGS